MQPLGRMSFKNIRIERLKEFMASRGLSGPVALGKAIGKSTAQTANLLSGVASFGEKVARSIEANAGLPEGWLDEFTDFQNTQPGPLVRGVVPLISAVQAGMFKEFVDNYQQNDQEFEDIPVTVPVNRYTFALRVQGDSMEPAFAEGMVVIVEPELDPQPGDYVIARNGDDEATFKQLVKDGPDWMLKPLNPRYPIKPLADAVIVGVVRAAMQRFR